ncbi:zinc-binding dehydrogenase [Amycolatopsis sp. YIM 10]|uniref:zinc-binding dehydrogenase n=1 Tax=Amycolatopsis sp. YIM 10 TaxID=2653857 RepID=UPI001D15CCD8|nr:zinc-binding dehydrogenase [Amycolatopsis sp. YIM 10]
MQISELRFVEDLPLGVAVDVAEERPGGTLCQCLDVGAVSTIVKNQPAARSDSPGGSVGVRARDHIMASRGYVLASTVHGRRRVRFFRGDPYNDLLAELTRLTDNGSLRPLVDRAFPLADIAEAHRALEDGGIRGKIVVTVRSARPAEWAPAARRTGTATRAQCRHNQKQPAVVAQTATARPNHVARERPGSRHRDEPSARPRGTR